MKRLLLALVATLCLYCCTTQPTPVTPVPDAGTGGTAATGGAAPFADAGTGGSDAFALCYAATRADPDKARQARDNGMTVDALAKTVCSFDVVLKCFADGVCK